MKRILFVIFVIVMAVTGLSVTVLSAEAKAEIDEIKFVKGDQNSVTFSWSEAEGVNYYYIYKLNIKQDRYELIASTKDTQITIQNLESGKTCYFRVLPITVEKAIKKQGEISDAVVCVTAPVGDLVVSTKDITKNSVTLSWNRIPGATGYKVYYYDRVKGRYIAYRYTDKTSMTVKGFKENTEYKFKVRAFRWVGDALTYGITSDEYSEYTHTEGTPKTKAQVARAYNTLINTIKSKSTVTMQYTKTIDTEFIGCSKQNLALTVENTSNLFSGSLTKTYNFSSGKSGSLTVNGLLEPYSKQAGVSKNDIASFNVKEVSNGYTISMTLRGDTSSKNLFSDGALTVTDIKKLDTTPLAIRTAESYYDKATIAFAVRDGKLKILKINASVISDIGFSVAGVSADARIRYTLYERYGLTY